VQLLQFAAKTEKTKKDSEIKQIFFLHRLRVSRLTYYLASVVDEVES